MHHPMLKAVLLAPLIAAIAARSCVNLTIPVTISARNAVFGNWAVPQTNLDAIEFIQNFTRQARNGTAEALTGYATVSGTYKIKAGYCVPKGKSSSVVQVLTHGIGFDRTYWDLSYNDYSNSYVNAALAAGYNVFYYDRLGIGESSHGDPRDEIQIFLEVAALVELTKQLRAGKVAGIKQKFSKVVHVGHSFGSLQSYALSAEFPALTDGVVLTGFSPNTSFVPLFAASGDVQQANLNQPFRFGSAANARAIASVLSQSRNIDQKVVADYGLTDYFAQPAHGQASFNYPNGYITNRDVGSLQYMFLLPPFFDTGLALAGEATKQPFSIGEFLTVGSVPQSSPFAGPVLVFTGIADEPFCGGDCLATGGVAPSLPWETSFLFPKVTQFEAYLQPNTGHGLTFHHNATAGYNYISSWLKAHGLGA